jgi:glutaredoxin/glutathione-dependent peroxiredoxin
VRGGFYLYDPRFSESAKNLDAATFKQLTANGVANIDTATLLKDKKVVLCGLPDVYTPVCSAYHLAGFVAKADDLKAKGIDAIACVSVNDPSPDLRKVVPN